MSDSIFRRLLPSWARTENPVYRLETHHRRKNRAANNLRWGCLPLILLTTNATILLILTLVGLSQGYYDPTDTVLSTLALVILGLQAVQLTAGAGVNILTIVQAAPTISGEVELQSWRLLRTTILPLREIVLAKLAGALNELRLPLAGLLTLRFISTITGLIFGSYLIRSSLYYSSRRDILRFWMDGEWIPITIAILVFLLYYTLQPAIQFGVNGVLGMLASAYARSRSRAVASALIGRLALWIASIVGNVGAMYGLGYLLIANWSQPAYAPIEAFRNRSAPSDLAIVWVFSMTIAVYILIVLLGQIGFITIGHKLTLRRSRHLEV